MDSVYKNQQMKLIFTSLGSPNEEKMPDEELRKDNIQQYLYTILEKVKTIEEETKALKDDIKDVKDNYLSITFTDIDGNHTLKALELLNHLFISAPDDKYPELDRRAIVDVLAVLYKFLNPIE